MHLEHVDFKDRSDHVPDPPRTRRYHQEEATPSRVAASWSVSWSVSTHIKRHGYFSVPTWQPDLRRRLQQSITEAMNQVDSAYLVIWKIGACDGVSESFWIPQISFFSDIVFICSFKYRDALSERFVAFTQLEQGLEWIQGVNITARWYSIGRVPIRKHALENRVRTCPTFNNTVRPYPGAASEFPGR